MTGVPDAPRPRPPLQVRGGAPLPRPARPPPARAGHRAAGARAAQPPLPLQLAHRRLRQGPVRLRRQRPRHLVPQRVQSHHGAGAAAVQEDGAWGLVSFFLSFFVWGISYK